MLSPRGCREGAGAIVEPIAVPARENAPAGDRVEGVISAGDSVVRRSFSTPGSAGACSDLPARSECGPLIIRGGGRILGLAGHMPLAPKDISAFWIWSGSMA